MTIPLESWIPSALVIQLLILQQRFPLFSLHWMPKKFLKVWISCRTKSVMNLWNTFLRRCPPATWVYRQQLHRWGRIVEQPISRTSTTMPRASPQSLKSLCPSARPWDPLPPTAASTDTCRSESIYAAPYCKFSTWRRTWPTRNNNNQQNDGTHWGSLSLSLSLTESIVINGTFRRNFSMAFRTVGKRVEVNSAPNRSWIIKT